MSPPMAMDTTQGIVLPRCAHSWPLCSLHIPAASWQLVAHEIGDWGCCGCTAGPGAPHSGGHQTGQHRIQVGVWQRLERPPGELVLLSCLCGPCGLCGHLRNDLQPSLSQQHPPREVHHPQWSGLCPFLPLPNLNTSVHVGLCGQRALVLGHSYEEDHSHNRTSGIKASAITFNHNGFQPSCCPTPTPSPLRTRVIILKHKWPGQQPGLVCQYKAKAFNLSTKSKPLTMVTKALQNGAAELCSLIFYCSSPTLCNPTSRSSYCSYIWVYSTDDFLPYFLFNNHLKCFF